MPANGTKNLIPANTRPREEHLALVRKGGMAKSPLKNYAARIREIRKRVAKGQLKTNDEEWLLMLATNDKWSALSLMDKYLEIEKAADINNQELQIRLTYLKKELHKTLHGEKIKSENININLSFTDAMIQAYERARRNDIDDLRDVQEHDGNKNDRTFSNDESGDNKEEDE